MKELLREYLSDPNTVKGSLMEVVDVVQREAPLVVNELIRWTVIYNLIWFIGSILIIVGIAILLKKKLWKWSVDNFEDDDLSILGIIIPLGGIVIAIKVMSCHFGWIMPLVAPRLFLLEYLAQMIK